MTNFHVEWHVFMPFKTNRLETMAFFTLRTTNRVKYDVMVRAAKQLGRKTALRAALTSLPRCSWPLNVKLLPHRLRKGGLRTNARL